MHRQTKWIRPQLLPRAALGIATAIGDEHDLPRDDQGGEAVQNPEPQRAVEI